MKKFLMALLTLASLNLTAQECAVDILPDNKYVLDETAFQSRLPDDSTIYTLAVRVCVVHLGEPEGVGTNISDAQISNAIGTMNDHFRGINPTLGYQPPLDIGVEYCLDSILRFDGTSVPNYEEQGLGIGTYPGASVGSLIDLYPERDREKYYHIWVVSEIGDNNGGAGIQAFAYYPVAPLTYLDGTYILHNILGFDGSQYGWPSKSYTDESEILTHELGHALLLAHTFDNTFDCFEETDCFIEGDRICDTPPTPFFAGNCEFPACGGLQMVENYMDYTPEDCKGDFTPGQKVRMRWATSYYRSGQLVENNGEDCIALPPPLPECEAVQYRPIGLGKSFGPTPWPNGVVDRVKLKFYEKYDFSSGIYLPYQQEDSISIDIEFWPTAGGDTSMVYGKTKHGRDFFKWPLKFSRDDIQPATMYTWRVRAKCNDEYSEWGNGKFFTTPPFDPETGVYFEGQVINIDDPQKVNDYLRGK